MRYQKDEDDTAPPPADRDDAPGTEGHLYVGDAYDGDPARTDAEQVTVDDTELDRPAAVDPIDDAAVPTERLAPPSAVAADSDAGPAEVQRVHGDLVYTEPADPVEAEETGTADAESVDAEPVDAEPVDAEPVDAEPVETEPVDAEVVADESVADEPAEAGTADAEATETEPVAVEPTDTEPVDAERVDAERFDAEPVFAVEPVDAEETEADERPVEEPLVLDDVADVPRPDDDGPAEEAGDIAAEDVAADDLAAAEPVERDPRADDDPEALGPVAVVGADSTVDETPAALSDVDDVEEVPAVVPVPEATAEPARTSENGELLPGAVESAPLAGFWPEGVADGLRERWRDVQLRFLDEPREAAEEAKALVGEAVTALSNGLNSRAEELHGWLEGNGDTEELRVAVRRYRDLLDRLFSL